MLRQLILTLTGLLLSFQIQALGLSRIEVYSKLNEPLNAKIEVMSVPKGEAGNIRINLASNESFRRAGLDRTQILTSLQFKVQATGNAGAVIRLSSQQPLREPFLNFLLEVTWPSGRILREYTVLLDPPLYEKKLRAVTAPPPPPSLRALAADPPTRLARTAVAKSKSATKPSRTSTPRVSKANRKESSGGRGRGGSYSVSSNDTLWQIANQTKPRSVSLEQHMVNIYHANPGAFIRRNMNLIQAGKTLKIPGWDSKHVAPPPAVRVAKSQVDDTSSTNRTAEETEAAPESAPPVVPAPTKKVIATEPQVRITAPESTNQQEGSVGEAQNEQFNKLNKEVKRLTEANVSINAENKELKKELGSTKDLVVTMKKQLDEVNNLLKLQNQNLAKLQEQLAKQTKNFDKQAKDFAQARQELVDAKKALRAAPPTMVAATPVATAKPPVTADQATPTAEKPAPIASSTEVKPTTPEPTASPAESKLTPPTVPTTPGQEEPKEVAGTTAGISTTEPELTPQPSLVPTGEEIISPTEKPEDTTTGKTTESTTEDTEITAATDDENIGEAGKPTGVKEDTQKTTPVVEPTAPPPVEASLMDTANDLVNQVPGGWLTIGGIGGGTVLLLLLGGFLKRRRKDEGGVAEWKEGTELTEGEILAELARLEAETQPQKKMANDEDNIDEFLDNLKAEEEPADEELLENVDVYIAYETFDKAEELLKPAIEQHPTVQKYRLKLLEVYAAAKQEDKFEEAAKVFYAETGGQSPFWDEVLTQWYTLGTDRPLDVSEVEFTPAKSTIKAKPSMTDREEDVDGLGLAGLAGAAALGAGAAMVLAGDEEATTTDTEMDKVLAGLADSGLDLGVNDESDDFNLDLGTPLEGLEEIDRGSHDDNDADLSLNLGDDLNLDLGSDLESNVTAEATTEEEATVEDDGLSFTTDLDLDQDEHETTTTSFEEEVEEEDVALDSSTDDELDELTTSGSEDDLSLDLGETFEDTSDSEAEDLSLDMGHEETETLDEGLSFDDDLSSDLGETTDEDMTAIGSDDDLSFDDESTDNLSAEEDQSMDLDLGVDDSLSFDEEPAESLSAEEDLSMELDGDTESASDSVEENLSLDELGEEEIPETAQDNDELSLLDDEELSLGMEATEAAASSATEEELSLDFEEDNTEMAPSTEEESLSLDEFSEDETTALSTETDLEEDLSLGDLDSELDTTSEETEVVETDELSLDEDLSMDTDNESAVATTMDSTEDDLSLEEDLSLDSEDLSLDSEESSLDMGMADEVSTDESELEEDGELSFEEELSSDTLDLDAEGAESNETDLATGSEELSLGEDDELSFDMGEEEETANVATDELSLEEDEGALADFAETEALSATDAIEESDLSMDLDAEDLDANLSLDDLDSDTTADEIGDISSTVEDEDAIMPTLDEDSELTTTEEISDDNELDMGSLGLDDDLAGELGIQLDDDDSTLDSGSDHEFGDLLTGMEDNEFGELSGESEMNLDGSDDINSKFDLAQMYIDIEDTDSARTTLEEIVAEGDEEQKQRAQKMMKGLV